MQSTSASLCSRRCALSHSSPSFHGLVWPSLTFSLLPWLSMTFSHLLRSESHASSCSRPRSHLEHRRRALSSMRRGHSATGARVRQPASILRPLARPILAALLACSPRGRPIDTALRRLVQARIPDEPPNSSAGVRGQPGGRPRERDGANGGRSIRHALDYGLARVTDGCHVSGYATVSIGLCVSE